jgi:plastocyanin
MLRTLKQAVPVVALLVVFAQAAEAAPAATVNVTISNFQFSPTPAKLHIGDSVLWTNNGPSSHTTTSDSPFSLWDSGTLGVGATFSWPFNAAGIFPYHCSIHASMHGLVGVLGAALPRSGPAGTQFNIRVSKITAPPQFTYDAQMKVPGGQWTDWMTGFSPGTVTWDSTGAQSGQYQFRSRLRRLSDGSASGYSPATTVTVT